MTTALCSSQTDCAPCADGAQGCFVNTEPGGYYGATLPATGATGSKVSINLKCSPGDSLAFNFKASDLTNGKVVILFNGEILAQTGENLWDYTTNKLAAHGTLNSFEAYFVKTNLKKTAKATIWIQLTQTRPEFTQCEDMKACLGQSGLGQHWGTEAANSLRESTKNQWQCLKDKSKDKTVCPVWKKCLENSGKSDQILKILEAAGASKAPLINTLPSKTKGDSKGCRNPFVSDPESWDCSCHEWMVAKCQGQDFGTCYRNQLCKSSKVCASWKKRVGCNSGVLDLAVAGKESTGVAWAHEVYPYLAPGEEECVGW